MRVIRTRGRPNESQAVVTATGCKGARYLRRRRLVIFFVLKTWAGLGGGGLRCAAPGGGGGGGGGAAPGAPGPELRSKGIYLFFPSSSSPFFFVSDPFLWVQRNVVATKPGYITTSSSSSSSSSTAYE